MRVGVCISMTMTASARLSQCVYVHQDCVCSSKQACVCVHMCIRLKTGTTVYVVQSVLSCLLKWTPLRQSFFRKATHIQKAHWKRDAIDWAQACCCPTSIKTPGYSVKLSSPDSISKHTDLFLLQRNILKLIALETHTHTLFKIHRFLSLALKNCKLNHYLKYQF